MSGLLVVVPAGIDDPARVSGGNRYDREVCDRLRAVGWTVSEIAVEGGWPRPDDRALTALAAQLDTLPSDALVLVDGLIASAAAPVLVSRSSRLRFVVLVHMLFGEDDGAVPARCEAAVLSAARAVVTTSEWTRRRVLERYRLPAACVHVARPGSDPAPVSRRRPDGQRLLCVGTLSRLKGQDVLLAALGRMTALPWSCALVGPSDREPGFAASLVREAVPALAGRIRMPGTCTAEALRREYADADLLVVPSRAETYGMVVVEALAAGVPVVASAVGGLPEAVGRTPSGVPGLLVPPDDPAALAGALERWLTDDRLRCRLRSTALARRDALPGWARTGDLVSGVLASVPDAADPVEIRGGG
ncbi:glycosyltransferase family 1 protein [Blastococcus sp. TF02-09]|uniref:glycosyltransferase family 4 protein n=1 Tax=Blastococcus sp. TF02-09 TaxID=2250576 RepID=UPI000DE802F5|nr:glycosyltransferase family 4 protein [Blastococcus sp. TF02-9]RBY81287.1 glycosyltransferase family 1 protein [Blastococcus sp. TF02-9]